MASFNVATPFCYVCHREIIPSCKATYVRPEGTYLLHQEKCFTAFIMAHPRFKEDKESTQKAVAYQQEYKAKGSELCSKLAIITSLFILIFGLAHKL